MAVSAQAIRCPNCGATLDWDGVSETVKCISCQSTVPITDSNKIKVEHTHSGSVELNEDKKYSNFLDLAESAYSYGNMQEAYDYYTKALEIKQDNYLPVLRKGLCTGYLCSDIALGEKSREMLSWIGRAANMIYEDKDRKLVSEEIKRFARIHRTRKGEIFADANDCAQYILGLYNKILLLDQLFVYVDRTDEEGCIEYIETELCYCDMVKSPIYYQVWKYNAKQGEYAERTRYSVGANILNTVASVRNKFINIYNQYILPKLEMVKADISKTKEQIEPLPNIFKVCKGICNKWVFLAAVLLLLLSAVIHPLILILSVLIWITQLVFFIIFRVKDKDKSVRNLYKTLKNQKEKYAALKKKIRK